MSLAFDQHERFQVLIASPSISMFLENQLGKMGNSAMIFTHTDADTVLAVTGRYFDLILIDLDLHARDILPIIRRTNSVNYQTPVIVLTDILDISHRKQLISAGFDDCIIKPVTENQIADLVSFWRQDNALKPYFDSITTLLSKTKNNTSLVNTLFNKLFEELPAQIANIERALEEGDVKSAFDIAHSLNGSAKTCYLTDIAETANALEMSLIKYNRDYADGFFLMLKQKIASFIEHREPILAFLQARY